MKQDLSRFDLLQLLCSIDPHPKIWEHETVKKYGYIIETNNKWHWKRYELQISSLSEKEIWELYQTVKKSWL